MHGMGKGRVCGPYTKGPLSFCEGELMPVTGFAPAHASNGFIGTWEMTAASILSLDIAFMVPRDFITGSTVYVDVWWTPAATGVGPNNVIKYRLGVGRQQIGVAPAADTNYDQDVIAGTQNIWHVTTTTLTAMPWVVGDSIHLRVTRIGNDAGDNFPATMWVAGAKVRYA